MASGSTLPKIIKVGPCGGSDGVPVTMDPIGVTRIVKIVVWQGDFVNALSVDYERNGRLESFKLGGNGGRRAADIVLQPSEYITSIKGKIGKDKNIFTVVRSLVIKTNLDIYGPFGGTGGGFDFELPAIDTEITRAEIIGFHGSYGGLLDQIGVYIKVSSKTGGAVTGRDACDWGSTGGGGSGENAFVGGGL